MPLKTSLLPFVNKKGHRIFIFALNCVIRGIKILHLSSQPILRKLYIQFPKRNGQAFFGLLQYPTIFAFLRDQNKCQISENNLSDNDIRNKLFENLHVYVLYI
jgi:hypothetical protein